MNIYEVIVTKDTLEFRFIIQANSEESIPKLVKNKMSEEGYGLGYKLKSYQRIITRKDKVISFNVVNME